MKDSWKAAIVSAVIIAPIFNASSARSEMTKAAIVSAVIIAPILIYMSIMIWIFLLSPTSLSKTVPKTLERIYQEKR